MPTLYGAWGSNKEIIFNFPKITDVKYSGYSVSSNICKVSNTSGNLSSGWGYATTTISTKNESGVLTQRISSYRSTLNEYGDVFLKNLDDSSMDIGIYLNKDYPYAQIVINPESCSITTATIPYVTYSLVYAVPVISNIVVNRKYSTQQLTVDFSVNTCDSYSITVNGNTVTNTKVLNEGYFNNGLNTISITCVNGDKSATKEYQYTFEQTQPTVSNFTVESVNGYVDEKVDITFTGTLYTRFSVYNNDKVILNGTGNKATLPSSGLVIGTNKLHVVLYNDLIDSKHGNFTKSVSSSVVNKTLKTYTPTVSNVILENDGNLIDNDSVLTWQSTYQNTANIYINDALYRSVSTEKALTISKGAFKVGQNKVKVEIIKAAVPGVANSEVIAYNTTTYTMTRIMPTISELSTNGANTDNTIRVSWKSTNQTTYKLYQDSRLIVAGGDEKFVDIEPGTLSPTNGILKVVIYYNSGFDVISIASMIDFSGTQNTPIIYGLEPSNISINVDDIIEVTFSTNDYCDEWEIAAAGSIIRGTNSRSIAFPKNAFNKGSNTIKLTTHYSPAHNASEVRVASKVVTFTGYGRPSSLAIDDRSVYTTATPTIEWVADSEQTTVQYILKHEGVEVENKTVITTDNFIKLGVLENHKTYVLHIRIKNSYDLWSEYAVKEFETNFNEIDPPTIEVFPKGGDVLIIIKSHQGDTFNGICLFRKLGQGEWVQITDQRVNSDDSILDSTCIGEGHYKARVYDSLGGYADSDIKSVNISIKNYHLSNVQDVTQNMQLDFVKPSYTTTNDVVVKRFAGNSKPRVFKGNAKYDNAALTVTLESHELLTFLDFIENGEIFCYRDRRGKKMFCFASIDSYTPVNAFFMEVSLTLTEVNFIEKGIYSGSGWKQLVYLNGSYYLDGAIDLSGYISSDEVGFKETSSNEGI